MPTYFDRFNYPEDTAGWGFLGYNRTFNESSDFNIFGISFFEEFRLGKKKIEYSWGADRKQRGKINLDPLYILSARKDSYFL